MKPRECHFATEGSCPYTAYEPAYMDRDFPCPIDCPIVILTQKYEGVGTALITHKLMIDRQQKQIDTLKEEIKQLKKPHHHHCYPCNRDIF